MRLKSVFLMMVAVFLVGGVQAASAAGPHDENCVDCHNVHYAKGSYILGAEPNTSMRNPSSKTNVSGVDSMCLGCHNEKEGIMPIHLSTTHPTGIVPTYVKVPGQLLSEGKFSCISCHNPHPSNANFKYLVVDTKKGAEMGQFCAVCHADQADKDVLVKAKATKINAGPRVEPRVSIQTVTKDKKKKS